jgi:ATP-dependent DNA helicase RecG
MDNNGCIWIKTGADKRKATSREEIRRMFQANHVLHGDEMLVGGMSTDNIDKQLFEDFYEKNYGEALDSSNLSQIFNNLNLSKDGQLNVAGALLFGKGVQHKLPAFIVKCVRFPGRDVTDVNYLDSQDIDGTLRRVFDDALGFLLRCISRVQNDQSVNSLGELEVPKIVFEELLANALIHRDYFISAPIKIFAFVDRIEIVSPGHLPNNLSIEHIKNGNSNIRNPILASFATRLLPYRGLGSGIQRALKAYPHIELAENREENWFKATILLP